MAAPVLDDEIGGEAMLVDRHGRSRGRLDQCALDLGTGCGTAGVHDPRVTVSPFAREL